VALALIAAGPSCSPGPTTPEVRTYYPIELGNLSNFVNIDRSFFLGHRVERFRLKLRLVNPGRSAQWISGLTVSLGQSPGVFQQQFQSLPAGAEADGSFWTQEFTTNVLLIQIRSGGAIVSFDGGQPRLEIVAVERHFLPNVNRTDLPTASSGARRNVLTVERGVDAIAFTPGLDEALHYRIPAASAPQTQSLYISPRALSLNNSVGLRVHLSTSGFVSPDANTTWVEPDSGDSGIYREFTTPAGRDMFVTVVSSAMVPYLVSHSSLVERFENIVMERDGMMRAAPDIDLGTIRGAASQQQPFNAQMADYLQAQADFDRRIRETLTIATAFALDATDGQMRLGSAELHRNIRGTRNVDIQFAICGTPPCRANAGSSRISMFDVDVNNPASAGWTLHHEWGHWEYDLPDEYLDLTGPPPVMFSLATDANSLMGTSASTEFCTPNNHIWAMGAVAEMDSSWTQIIDQFPGVTLGPRPFPNLSHGRYLDVLNRLQGLVTLTIR
jgi:hypothetical protein